MASNNDILFASADRAMQQLVAKVIGSGSDPLSVTACADLRDLQRRLEEHPRTIALVDLGEQPQAALASLASLPRRFSGTHFVAVCGTCETEVLHEAMHVGVRHCLLHSAIETGLPGVLKRILQESAGIEIGARAVTVLSAAGGSGATTIAINLAQEAQLATGKPVLLVDMDRQYGSMGAYLGLNGEFGLQDVLSYSGTIDDNLVRTTASRYAEGLDVLLGPASLKPGTPRDLAFERLDAAFAAFARAYATIVIDASRVSIDVASELALASTMTLIVFEVSVVDIRSARALAVALNERGVTSDSLLVVANRYRKRNPMLSYDRVSKALSKWTVVHVVNDHVNALKSANLGKPLAQTAPRSELRRNIEAIAALALGGQLKSSRGRKRK